MLNAISTFLIPVSVLSILCIGYWKDVNVFDAFIEGAKEGIDITFKIAPYLIAIFVAIDLMNSSGLLNLAIAYLKPITAFFNFPPEVLPLILIKPFSGSGYTVVLADIFKQYGTETFIGKFASILAGSTETIFYVLSVYFGVIGIKNLRHALIAAITTEIAAIIIAFILAKMFF
jgi:spore maturation protein B